MRTALSHHGRNFFFMKKKWNFRKGERGVPLMKDIVQPPDHNLGLSAELKSVIFLQYYSFAYNLLYTPMLNYSRKSNAHIICCTMFTYLTSVVFLWRRHYGKVDSLFTEATRGRSCRGNKVNGIILTDQSAEKEVQFAAFCSRIWKKANFFCCCHYFKDLQQYKKYSMY